MKLSDREELLIEIFRSLHGDQRNDIFRRIRAWQVANKISTDKLELDGEHPQIVGDKRIAALFGAIPGPRKRRQGDGESEA